MSDAGLAFVDGGLCPGLAAENGFCWESPLPQGNSLHDVLVGKGGFWVLGSGGSMFWVTDAGAVWTKASVPSVLDERADRFVNYVSFASAEGRTFALSDSEVVLELVDGGWKEHRLGCTLRRGARWVGVAAGPLIFVDSERNTCDFSGLAGVFGMPNAAESVWAVREFGDAGCFVSTSNSFSPCRGDKFSLTGVPAFTPWRSDTEWVSAGVDLQVRAFLLSLTAGGERVFETQTQVYAGAVFRSGSVAVSAQGLHWLVDGGVTLLQSATHGGMTQCFGVSAADDLVLAVGEGGNAYTWRGAPERVTPLGRGTTGADFVSLAATPSTPLMSSAGGNLFTVGRAGSVSGALPYAAQYGRDGTRVACDRPGTRCLLATNLADKTRGFAFGPPLFVNRFLVDGGPIREVTVSDAGWWFAGDGWPVGEVLPVDGGVIRVEDAGCSALTIAGGGGRLVAAGEGCAVERVAGQWGRADASVGRVTSSWVTETGEVFLGDRGGVWSQTSAREPFVFRALPPGFEALEVVSVWANEREVWVLAHVPGSERPESHVFWAVAKGPFSVVFTGAGYRSQFTARASVPLTIRAVRGNDVFVYLVGDTGLVLRRPLLAKER